MQGTFIVKTSIRLYKFTREKYAVDNIKERQLKISFPDEVNDIFELKPFDFGTRDIRRTWQQSIINQSKTHGFISFSKSWRNPTMWGHYAEDNKGVCFGFDIPTDYVTQIQYVPDLRHFDRRALENGNILSEHMDYALQTKAAHWVYEQEWRMYIRLEQIQITKKQRRPKDALFQKFNENLELKEIIIGERSSLKRKNFSKVIQKRDLSIKYARAAYRDFSIVQHRNK